MFVYVGGLLFALYMHKLQVSACAFIYVCLVAV